MSTIGANVQWMPTARASRAATAWPRSIVSGSQEAAIAIGTGRIVRSPWITSKPNSTGMPSRLPSIASRCRRLISAGSVTNSSDPAPPRAQRRLDHRRLRDDVQPSGGSASASARQAEVEVLGELPGLLRRRHLRDQLVDPRPDRLFISHVERILLASGDGDLVR